MTESFPLLFHTVAHPILDAMELDPISQTLIFGCLYSHVVYNPCVSRLLFAVHTLPLQIGHNNDYSDPS